MNPNKLLEQIGLSPNEAKVYLALLKYKKATVTKLAEEAHVNRTTAYDILKYLNDKGLILKYIENKKTGFMIDSPRRLQTWLKDRDKNIKHQQNLLTENFTDLDYLFKAGVKTPRIQYFEGNDRLEDFISDTLLSNPKETIGYASPNINLDKVKTGSLSNKFIHWYARERNKRNIKGRYILQAEDKKSIELYIKKYYGKYLRKKPDLIKGKILPTKEKKYFLNETTVYDNKLAISHLGENFFGVIVESEDVANTQRIVFESLWKTLKEEIKI